jgi:hypothetical protein
MFSKDVVSGGTGVSYNADTIWILGRQQDKDEKTKSIEGYDFIINVNKSRYVREASKIPISVSFDGGINRWSGLLQSALEAGIIVNTAKGYYGLKTEKGIEGHFKAEQLESNSEFWTSLLTEEGVNGLASFLKKKYQLTTASILE